VADVRDVIARHLSEIVDRWSEAAARAAAARGLDRPELASLLAQYLLTLGGDGSGAAPSDEQQRLLRNHLSQRLRQSAELNQVVVELGVLASVIGGLFARIAPEERPPPDAVASLIAEITAAATVVARIFTEHMLEDERLEKRYGRLIQDVVSEAQHGGDGLPWPLADRLGQLVALVREAMAGDSAALLLRDARTERLATAAASGIESYESFAVETLAQPDSFVGRVTRTEEGTVCVDVATTELRVDEALRRAGIRMLLGVRLPLRRALVGVLEVGRREPRPFGANELRRFESLAERLTLHLDTASLYAQLDERMRQLQTFVDTLAHDLRGPLTSARLAVELLREGEPDPVALARQGDKILRQLDKVQSMITDLLDAHRIAAGEPIPLHVAEDDVGALARDVAAEANARGGARVVVRSRGQLRGAFGVTHVRRALWNLVTNALKYGDPYAPVTIDAAGDRVGAVVSVHNEGAPIPPEDQARLWRPFTQSHRGAPSREGGWGLGLALVHGCAAAHGGSVRLRSAPGMGTTVSLAIPWQAARQPEAGPTVGS
jgi:signal transduction histidine kinase